MVSHPSRRLARPESSPCGLSDAQKFFWTHGDGCLSIFSLGNVLLSNPGQHPQTSCDSIDLGLQASLQAHGGDQSSSWLLSSSLNLPEEVGLDMMPLVLWQN